VSARDRSIAIVFNPDARGSRASIDIRFAQ
jgi:hypothetical protein